MFKNSREASPVSDGERAAAQAFKERVSEYNEILTSLGQKAADTYAEEAIDATRSEYRQARA